MTRILIVEDDPTQARALSRAFSKLRPDLSISTAANGLQAMKQMAERSVDLILTDLQMPEMDGFQLITWLHNNHPDVAVFTMSAFGNADTAAELGNLGALEYFPKPVDAKQVLSRLTDALNQSVRGHVQNVSLASLLQLLEMERKTCTLAVSYDDKTGVLVLRKGTLVSARCGELQAEAAAIAVISWPYPSINISRHSESDGVAIQESVGFIVMEAMRLQDEAMRTLNHNGVSTSWPAQRRTWRPSSTPSDRPLGLESSRPRNGDMGLPTGARAVAMVETATGNILCSAAEHDCPVGELARMAAQMLLQEAATLELCTQQEGVEELVLSTSSRCDVIRPLGGSQFALLVFAPEETNLVMARFELDRFIALQHLRR